MKRMIDVRGSKARLAIPFLPPVMGAVWFGMRGAFITTLTISVRYSDLDEYGAM